MRCGAWVINVANGDISQQKVVKGESDEKILWN